MSAQHKPALRRVEVLQLTQQTVVVIGNQKRERCAPFGKCHLFVVIAPKIKQQKSGINWVMLRRPLQEFASVPVLWHWHAWTKVAAFAAKPIDSIRHANLCHFGKIKDATRG
jgi:hypothetical protein